MERALKQAYEDYKANGGELTYDDWLAEGSPDATFAGVVRRSAEEVNKEFEANDWEPPYKPGTQVTEYTISADEPFVRVHFGPNEKGDWLVKKEAIQGLTPEEIKRKYSLKHTPTHVSDVTATSGSRIRKGKVNSNFGGNSGATQYQLLENSADRAIFDNSRPISEL
jgi:filamentous hemagglutinin